MREVMKMPEALYDEFGLSAGGRDRRARPLGGE
jgi:hypothetical protein